MKTVEDLKRLREQLQADNRIRHAAGTQIIVGMGTCGIAAGAREVLAAILDEIARLKIQDVNVTQTGAVYPCQFAQVPEFLIGSIRDRTFSDLWNDPDLQ